MTEIERGEVLLFNARAMPHEAARLHAESCQLVSAARQSTYIAVVEANLDAEIADLEARGFPVKRCKCLKEHPQCD